MIGPLPKDLEVFINGCDAFPDGIGKISWKSCCDLHDIAYTLGGTIAEKFGSDWDLGLCVAAKAGPVGLVMFLGCLIPGCFFFRFKSLQGKNLWEMLFPRKADHK
jgi:hypothetical protein